MTRFRCWSEFTKKMFSGFIGGHSVYKYSTHLKQRKNLKKLCFKFESSVFNASLHSFICNYNFVIQWHGIVKCSTWYEEKLRTIQRESNNFNPINRNRTQLSAPEGLRVHPQVLSHFSKDLSAAMERVLKRVGLSKRSQVDSESQVTANETVQIRRRRRSKSRRRPRTNPEINKKSRGIFNIDWDVVKDCKSCKSRAITRRFCSKKSDNELYRSNSFKFERFIRNSEDLSPIRRKVSSSVCFGGRNCVILAFVFTYSELSIRLSLR